MFSHSILLTLELLVVDMFQAKHECASVSTTESWQNGWEKIDSAHPFSAIMRRWHRNPSNKQLKQILLPGPCSRFEWAFQLVHLIRRLRSKMFSWVKWTFSSVMDPRKLRNSVSCLLLLYVNMSLFLYTFWHTLKERAIMVLKVILMGL